MQEKKTQSKSINIVPHFRMSITSKYFEIVKLEKLKMFERGGSILTRTVVIIHRVNPWCVVTSKAGYAIVMQYFTNRTKNCLRF